MTTLEVVAGAIVAYCLGAITGGFIRAWLRDRRRQTVLRYNIESEDKNGS